MGNTLIFVGIVVFALGLLMNVFQKFAGPILPGDIFIQKENFTFYFPVVTSVILSVILTVVLNLFK